MEGITTVGKVGKELEEVMRHLEEASAPTDQKGTEWNEAREKDHA